MTDDVQPESNSSDLSGGFLTVCSDVIPPAEGGDTLLMTHPAPEGVS